MFRRLTAFLLTTSITGAVTGAAVVRAAVRTSPQPGGGTWSARAAASYLDYRQAWWESWPRSARDHGTVCLSCHTALSYALARPTLGVVLHDTAEAAPERKLIGDVERRVRGWTEMQPYYGGPGKPESEEKARQSRGTESVLNALVLAERDARTNTVSGDARMAFANMWALQLTSGRDAGAWSWINFELEPWEASPSPYFGAALAAIAVGTEPGHYAASPAIRPNVVRLQEYLRDNLDPSFMDRLHRRDNPALFKRAMLLWASTRLPTLIPSSQQLDIEHKLLTPSMPMVVGACRHSASGLVMTTRRSPPQATAMRRASSLTRSSRPASTPASRTSPARSAGWLRIRIARRGCGLPRRSTKRAIRTATPPSSCLTHQRRSRCWR